MTTLDKLTKAFEVAKLRWEVEDLWKVKDPAMQPYADFLWEHQYFQVFSLN